MSDTRSKCWGINTEIFKNSSSSVNVLNLVQDKRCSWHRHKTKWNKFYVLSGKVQIVTESGMYILTSGMSFTVCPGEQHEFQSLESSVMLEIMYVEYDSGDIERERIGGDLDEGK